MGHYPNCFKGDIIYRGDDATKPLGAISRIEGRMVTVASDTSFIIRPKQVSIYIESGMRIRTSRLMKLRENCWQVVAEPIQ